MPKIKLLDLITILGTISSIIAIYIFWRDDPRTAKLFITIGALVLLCYILVLYVFNTKLKSLLEISKKFDKNNHINVTVSKFSDSIRQLTEEDFLKDIELRNVSEIYIIAHTGRNLFNALNRVLENIQFQDHRKNIRICVLVRNPITEIQQRSNQIRSTVNLIKKLQKKDFDIEIRHYQALPAFRSIIVYFKDGTRKSYLSTYEWIPEKKSQAFKWGWVIEDTLNESHPLVEMYRSWFKHFWGKNRIHTIVLDFDDTLVDSLDIQVKAWVDTIIYCINNSIVRIDQLNQDKIAYTINDLTLLTKNVKEIFLDKQMAPDIQQLIFPQINDEKIKRTISNYRFLKRKEYMKNVRLFSDVDLFLNRISKNYELAIVSATAEDIIHDTLREFKLHNYFPVLLGKDEPRIRWEYVFDKSYLLIKLSLLTGISLDRMIYIGDNQSDYDSAFKQLKMDFIEARIISQKEGVKSLIACAPKDCPPFFESYSDKQLEEIINKINEGGRYIDDSELLRLEENFQ